MFKLLFRMPSLAALIFTIIFTTLLVQSFSLSSQTNSFSLSLDLDSSEGDQAVQSLDVSPNQDVSIQIFGTDIQSASSLSVRFEYDMNQVVYEGFDAGNVLPNPDVRVEEGTNPPTVSDDSTSTILPHNETSFVEITIASIGSATVNSGLIGTLHLRTTDAFSQTEILLVRAELGRGGQVESAMLNLHVELQIAGAPSPDFDGSGFVDLQDLLLFKKGFGSRVGQEHYEVKYDLNGDGAIGVEDYLIFIQSYGKWVNRAPVFTSKTYVTYFIDENTPGGEPIGDPISATDADGNIVTYHLSGTDVDLFAFDAGTGQLQTKEGITYDYEHRTTYSVIVEASDGQGGTARLLVIIKINDLKEPPSSSPSNFLVIPDNESLTVHYAAVPDERGRPPVRGYHAEIRRGEKGPWGTRKTIYGRTNTSVYYHKIDVPRYQNSFLENGQLYQVRVRAYNSDGASTWSEPVSGIPVYTPPKEEPKLVQFQDGYAIIDLSPVTGEGGKIVVTQADLPATIPQEEVEGVFAEGVVVAVSNAPDVPASAGFILPVRASLFDIALKARINNRDVDIGDVLRAPVEICLSVPEDIFDPVIVHYDDGASAWEMLERQRVDNDVVCGYTDMFSLFGIGVSVNRAPVAVGRFEAQMLRVGDEGVTIDVSGKFSDPDNDVLTYEAVSSDEAVAKVDVSGSVVTLTPVAEGTATVTVTARDAAGSNQTAEQTIAVTINKADVKLSFGGATVSAQTYTVGREIDDIQLPEATGGTGIIGYTLTPALPDGLVLDGETRTISGTPTVAIEARDYKWRATDADENTIELLFSIAVEPANRAPVFTDISPLSVRENSTGVVVTVSATDADSDDSITGYGIASGADGDQFSIMAATGVLSFTIALNYEMPTDVAVTDPANAANNNEYIVYVTATGGVDARALTARDTLTISVMDVTEAPGKPAMPVLSDATLNSLKISWTAPANTGPVITAYDVRYIHSSASDADKADDDNWTEEEDAWRIGGGALEYTISPLDPNTSYDVQVRAENTEGESDWSDTLEKMTSANVAPVITSVSAFSVNENSTGDVATVTATDADDDDDIESYGIASGADGDQFSIVAATGVLTFTAAPNFEMPTDVEVIDPSNVANNNEYIVYVTATGGENARALTSSDTITVTVTDVNEAPVFSSAASVDVSENKQAVGTVVAEDVDADDSITGYALTGGADQALFEITSGNVLRFTTAPDFESPADALSTTPSNADANNEYIVEVTATGGAGARTMSVVQTITVTVTDENEAPIFATISPPSVSENSTGALVTVVASDEDTADNIESYGIDTNAADGSQFSIDTSTGVLTFTTAPNFEDAKDVAVTDPASGAGDNEYIVIVTATGGENARALTGRDTIKVTVKDVDGEAPGKPAMPTLVQATVNSLKISWSTPTNTGPPISSYDVRYILTSDDETDDDNWTEKDDVWTSVTGGDLEYTIDGLDPNTPYDVQVRAENAEGESDWSDTLEKMTTANVAPVITSVSAFSVNENSTGDVATVTATDADDDDNIESYDIVAGGDGAQFEIVASTGVLSFKAAPNFEDPKDVAFTDATNSANDNDANNNEYIVIVSATGGENARALTASDTIKVTVIDVNEAPVFSSAASFDVGENKQAVGTVVADDVDSEDSITGYALTGGADQALFEITSGNELRFTTAPDFESPADALSTTPSNAAANNEYIVEVTATGGAGDRELTAVQTITVTVTDENEAPVFATVSPPSVSENSTGDIVTVSASDEDTADNIESYGIDTSVADGSQFSIDTSTGVLTFTTAPNFESPTDVAVSDPANALENNEYIVIVTATSGADARVLTSKDTLKVTVMDVDGEAPGKPATPTLSQATVNSLKISWRAPTNTGPPITAYDVRYILTSADETDDDNWTEVTDAWTSGDGALEYTISPLDPNTSYDVQVRAKSDEGMSDWSDTLEKMTSANVAPVITSISAFSVNENSTGDVATVTAMDADDSDDIESYGIASGADGDQFSIVAATGVLTFTAAPNFEMPTDVVVIDPSNVANNNEYIVYVTATGGENARALTSSDTITVTVMDVNEAPAFSSAASFDVSENKQAVGKVEADDVDSGDSITGYALTGGDDQAKFSLVPETGALSFKAAPDYEVAGDSDTDNAYLVEVTATGGAGARAMSVVQAITVSVQDENEAPVFAAVLPISVNENITGDIVTVSASDEDTADNIESYGIDTSVADGSQFSIDTSTGVLTFKEAPNYEDAKDVAFIDAANSDNDNAKENNEYIVIVTATGGTGDRVLTASDTLKVTVTDVEGEAPGKPATLTIAEATLNSLKVSWSKPTNTGPAISSYDVRYILTSASADDKADDSNWTEVTGAWTSGALEYTISPLLQNTEYDIQVRARNAEGMSDWSSSVTGTTEQNVAPVITSVSSFSVDENITTATTVGTVAATDADEGDDITYGIASGADGDQFSIVEATGVLTFNASPNYEDPRDVAFNYPDNTVNAAENNEYIVIVTATGGTGAHALTARDTITVTVIDVTEPPGVPDAPMIAESTFNSLKIEWRAPTNTGPDISNYYVRYILTSASDDDKADDDNWTEDPDAWKSDTNTDLTYTISPLLQSTSYDVQVRAKSDEGMSDWSDTVVGTTGQNVVPVITSVSAFSVNENSTGDVATVTAMDADTEDSITGYGIATGADGDQFSIGSSTGVLTFNTAPNFEDPKDVAVTNPSNDAEDNEYIVFVTAMGGADARALTARDTITVTVMDVDGEAPGKPDAPTVSATFNSLTVSWSKPTNTGPDISSYDVRYILTSASDSDKADDSKWTLQEDAWKSDTNTDLTYTISPLTQDTSYDVQVRAESDEGMSDWSDTKVGTTVQNVAPVITSVSAFSVNENSTGIIALVSATDADNEDDITGYNIVAGADGSQFEITFSSVAQTGALIFKAVPNFEVPTDVAVTNPSNDAENNEYIVIVSATGGADARALTARDTITVTVMDVAEPPGKPDAPTVVAMFNSLKVSWTVPTNTGPDISSYDVRYILTSATDKADANWTEVTEAWEAGDGALEYTIGSLTQSTSYDVQVRAESDEGMSDWSDTKVETTGQNVAPVITSVSAFSVNENSTGDVATVTAMDADTADNIESYEIATGADGDQFSIGSSTGVLTFNTAPNFEEPTDVAVTNPSNDAENNEYIVFVTATSGENARALTSRDTITVTVMDVAEPPGKPDAPTVSATFNSLTVSWSKPTNTGPDISSYDVRYILTSDDETMDANWTVQEDAWKSDTNTDLTYTISPLTQDTSYDVQVRAESDEGMSDWSDTVVGTTEANVAPVITSVSAFSVNENSTGDVATVTAMDADGDDSITGYDIVDGADGDQFSIGALTGVLTFNTAPNFEAPTDVAVTDPVNAASNNEYIVYVTATGGADARALTSRDTITVTVMDVDGEAPGKPDAPMIAEATLNSLKISWRAPTNTGPDISSYDVRHILTSATDKADANWTEVTEAWEAGDGALEYTIGSLTQSTSYDVQVRAESDEGMSDWSDTVVGTTEANVAPVITSISAFSVNENSTGDVATVTAMDADTGDSITGYGIATGADGDQFTIGSSTGVLTFKVAPNYEEPTDVAVTNPSNDAEDNEYIVFVTATSGENARALTSRDTITVTVMDVAEPPGKPDAPTVSATFNSLTVSWSKPTNTGPDISSYDVRYILTSDDETMDANWTVQEDAWKLDTNTDLTYTISPLTQSTSYDVQVRAKSDEGMSDWSDTVVGTTGQNVAPVITSVSAFSVNENSTGDVATVTAMDADGDDSITGYGIATGADGDQFSIGALTGVLTFNTAPNFEDPKDVTVTDPVNAASNNEYIVYVTATGGADARALTAHDTLKVTVSDVNEVPIFSSAASFDVDENKQAVGTVEADDVDSQDSITGYAITGGDDRAKFSIVSGTGALSFKTAPDYEVAGDSDTDNAYLVEVTATGGAGTRAQSVVQAITVTVVDENEEPVFAAVSPISVNENSTAALVTVSASDEDTADNIESYDIATGADGSQFSIDASTGVLTFMTAPNFEDAKDVAVTDPANDAEDNEYIVYVTATGGAGDRALTGRDILTVTVMNVIEPPGKPDVPTVSATFNSLTVSWSAPTNTGPSISSYDVRYILTSASDDDKADDTKWTEVMDAWTSGALEYTIGSLDDNTSYDIQVRAENDEGMSDWSDTVVRMTEVAPGICGRTPAVQTAILSRTASAGVVDCALVTDALLELLSGTLDLNSQDVNTLKADDFSDLSSLQTLRLDQNSLEALPEGIFSGLSSLQILRLERNSLERLPEGLFSGLSSLQFLYLDRNSLETLPQGIFTGLSSLQILNLARNSLETLPEGIFSDLSSLERLELDRNDLSTLPEGIFTGLSSLQILNFKDNDFNTLPNGLFSGLPSALTELNLSDNMGAPFTLTMVLERTDNTALTAAGPATVVVKVAEGAPLDMTVSLSVMGGTLTDENMKPISQVTISTGSIQSIPITVRKSGASQTTLALGTAPALPGSYNSIQTAVGMSLDLFESGICDRTQAVQTAILSEIASISDCAMVTDAHLTGITGTLDLSDMSITELRENDFSGLSNLGILRLSRNSLQTLPYGLFSGLSSLERLELGRNDLATLSDNVFSDLSSLQALRLENNPLGELPDNVFSDLSSLQTLRLDNTALTNIPRDLFIGLSSLQTLDLSMNELEMLSDDIFSELSNLSSLSLSDNSLDVLPDRVFSGLSSLETLYLDQNFLETLPDGVFSGLSSLQGLELDRNLLNALPRGVFTGLSSLQRIKLDRNKLSTLPRRIFAGLSSLRILNLKDNDFETLPNGLFSGLPSALRNLNLSDNTGAPFTLTMILERAGPATVVAKVVQGAPFDMTVSLSITGGTLTDANGMSISQVTLSTGKIHSDPITVTQNSLLSQVTLSLGTAPALPGGYNEDGIQTAVGTSLKFQAGGICGRTQPVQTAILSEITGVSDCALVTTAHLTGITGTLDLSDKSISVLQASDFTGLSALQNLWLHDNDLSTLPAGVFSGLSSLQTLSLYRNNLSDLPDNVFSGLSSLQTLSLDNTGLTSLPMGIFTGLSALQNLWLHDNGLRSLSADVFSGLSSLQNLSLSNNRRLRTLPKDVFSGLSSLQTLRLYNTGLTSLRRDVFTGLSSLQTLNLDDNSLSNLRMGIFTGLSSLQTLGLSNNTLGSLPANVFSGLSNLRFLSLDGNGLGTLPDRAFSGLSSLQTLNLGGNTLSALPDSAFFDLSGLQILNLKGNMLTTLPDSVFYGLSILRELDVSDNTGAPFTVALALQRTDNTDLTAAGPATVVVSVAQGAPFDMTINLSARDVTMPDENPSFLQTTISKGSIQSDPVTVTQSGTSPIRVSLLGQAPEAPTDYEDIYTAFGSSLVLFGEAANRAPEAVGSIAAQILKVGDAAIHVEVQNNFSDPDGDILSYSATSDMPSVASARMRTNVPSEVRINPVSAGRATVTVTASDQTNSVTQEFEVIVKNTAPVVDKGLTDQIALSGSAFTYTFPADAFSDTDNDALTYTSSGEPAWLTFAPASRTFSGTPSNTEGSPFTIIVIADDGKDSQVQTSFTLTVPIGICGRTSQIQTAILSVIDGVNNCAHVTKEHLSGIVDSLDLRDQSITTLQANDFSGMPNLRILNFYDNDLAALPSGVFSGLSNLRFLSLYKNALTALPSGVFSGLSNLRFVSLDSNSVSTLPANVFSGLSNLEALSLNGNTLSALPAGVFSGLSSLSHLDVSGNTGAPFTLTLALERTDNTDLTAAGPATVVVKIAQGAPFDMTISLSVIDGVLTDEDSNPITEVTISKGSIQSEPITVTQSGTIATTVSLASAPDLPANYVGIQISVGTSLVLFGP